jgi:CRP-like cAMP-binding protein
MFACFVGLSFQGMAISTLSSLMMTRGLSARLYQQKIHQVDDYMRSKKLPAELRDKVRDFYQLTHAEGKMFDEDAILQELTPNLRREVLSFNVRALFREVPVMKRAPVEFTTHLAEALTPAVSFSGDKIIVEGQSGDEMFFIYSGTVGIYSRHQFNVTVPFITISTGCYFGDVAVFEGTKRTASVAALSVCILYSLARRDMLKCIAGHPILLTYMKEIARRRMLRMQFLDPKSDVITLTADEKVDQEDQSAADYNGRQNRRQSLRSQVAAKMGANTKDTKVPDATESPLPPMVKSAAMSLLRKSKKKKSANLCYVNQIGSPDRERQGSGAGAPNPPQHLLSAANCLPARVSPAELPQVAVADAGDEAGHVVVAVVSPPPETKAESEYSS